MRLDISITDMNVPSLLPVKNSSRYIVGKLEKKKFLLQFLPNCMENISLQKKIEYKNQFLKPEYLIDIVHNLVLKYYFKKENRYVLNATILKERYGYLYNYYINYLIDNKILYLTRNYRKGYSSRIYSLDSKIFNFKIKRYRNNDKVLIKKYKKKVLESVDFSDSVDYLIEKSVREKLISDIFTIDIDFDRSIFFLNSLKDDDLDIYNRNAYSVECINDKHMFYHFDIYGRFHTNFTILRSFIRKNCLLIDGEETCEIDISNSQPLFLSKLISDSNTKWVNKDEFSLFKELTSSGKYYQYLMNVSGITDKKEAKELTYKVLFGRNMANSKSDIMFRGIFPTIHNFIKLYKKENGNYKTMAYDLQKAESNLIFNKIIKSIMIKYPYVKIITVHDSIIVAKKYRDIVNEIFESELKNEFNI